MLRRLAQFISLFLIQSLKFPHLLFKNIPIFKYLQLSAQRKKNKASLESLLNVLRERKKRHSITNIVL
jgi:hypothetical protein